MYYSFFFILITLHFYFFPFQFLFLGICVHVTRESPVFPIQLASLPVFPTPLLMLCTESCVCCHTALRHCRYEWRLIQGGAVRSDCNLCLARLLCAVLNVIDCLLLGSFPSGFVTVNCGFSLVPSNSRVGLLWATSLFQHWSSFLLPSRESPCVLPLTLDLDCSLCAGD